MVMHTLIQSFFVSVFIFATMTYFPSVPVRPITIGRRMNTSFRGKGNRKYGGEFFGRETPSHGIEHRCDPRGPVTGSETH